MDNATPEPDRGSIMAAPKRAAATFLESIAAVLALCAKQAIKASRKLRSPPPPPMLFCPKRLIKNISSSTMKLIQKNKMKKKTKKDEWGDGGVWQKTILMGDKCQPLDFSGVIYYDSNGMQLNEVPLRSPRVSPLPGYLSSPSHSKVY